MSTVLERFAAYSASLNEAALPSEALHHARRCVLDWFAAAIPGGVEPPATLLTLALEEELDHGGATLVPSGRSATARAAALIMAPPRTPSSSTTSSATRSITPAW